MNPHLLHWQVDSVPLSHQWSPPGCYFAIIWITVHCRIKWASQAVLVIKNPPANAGGHGNLLKYSCLENPMDRKAWQATVHGVAKNLTWLKQLGMHTRRINYHTPPGSSVHRILQARVLHWVAISFSRGSSQPREWTQVSCIAGRFFTI